MYKVIGIDEAGKGPVIGSMFIAFSMIYLENGLQDLNSYQDSLKELGVTDSKKLSSKKRGEIYAKLKSQMDITYAQLTPHLIDTNFDSGGTLYQLEIDAIVKVLEQQQPQLVLIDALTSTPEKFGEELQNKLSFECKVIAENKADQNQPIVGAASIAAKQLREQELIEIKTNVNKLLRNSQVDLEAQASLGSGYPSDSKTQAFIKEHFNNKDFDFIFRKSWKTYQNVIKDKVDKTLDEYSNKDFDSL